MTVASPASTHSVYVIVLNWNGYRDTCACLDSLRRNGAGTLRLVVVDNSSSDGSQARIADWAASCGLTLLEYDRQSAENGILPVPTESDLVFIQTGGNLGFAGGNNVGIRYSLNRGAESVWLLNNDTIVEPGCLTPLVEAMLSDDHIGITGSCIVYYDRPDTIQTAGMRLGFCSLQVSHVGQGKAASEISISQGETDCVPACSMLVRSELIRDIGFMDEEYFMYHEDIDWQIRARRRGWKIVYVPTSRILHKCGGSTKKAHFVGAYYQSRNKFWLMWKNEAKKKWILVLPLLAAFLRNYLMARCSGDRKFARGIWEGGVDFFRGRKGFRDFTGERQTFAMFTPTWGVTVGGTAMVARGLVWGMQQVLPSCRFAIISSDTNGEAREKVHYLDGTIMGSRLLFALVALLRVRPSVIHCQGRVHQLLVGYLYKCLFDHSVRLLISFYTQPVAKSFIPGHVWAVPIKTSLMQRLKTKLTAFLLNQADHVVANSASLASNMRADVGAGFSRDVTVIPSGVEAPEIILNTECFVSRQSLQDSYPIFLTVGVFSWDWKVAGILLLLESFKGVLAQFPSARLVIVGDGMYKPLVVSKIAELGLQNSVVLTGNLQDTFVPLSASHIYCHLALNESCSVSILEAMVMGKPIIASAAGGNGELVSDGETGLVVEPTIARVQAAMIRLASDRAFAESLGAAARAAATDKYGWTTIAAQYARLYVPDSVSGASATQFQQAYRSQI